MQIPFVQNPYQIISEPTNSMNTVTPQMMYSNMSDTNERVKRLEHIMNEILSKLDLLELMAKKLDTFEVSISQMRPEIDDIKETQDKHIRIIDKQETHHHNVEGRLRNLENSNRQLEGQNIEIREKLLALQTHSMKNNLIFDGIRNNQGPEEKTEDVIRNFLSKELEITNVENIQFQNVHRLGERQDRRERGIIARFVNYGDHELVRKQAAEKLRSKPEFSVYQQFPREINDRRKLLVPKLKEFRRQKRKAKMVYDKLIVDGKVYDPPTHCEPPRYIPGLPVNQGNNLIPK